MATCAVGKAGGGGGAGAGGGGEGGDGDNGVGDGASVVGDSGDPEPLLSGRDVAGESDALLELEVGLELAFGPSGAPAKA